MCRQCMRRLTSREMRITRSARGYPSQTERLFSIGIATAFLQRLQQRTIMDRIKNTTRVLTKLKPTDNFSHLILTSLRNDCKQLR